MVSTVDGSESKKKPRGGKRPGAGGGNRFVPVQQQRDLVKLAISEGIAHERICRNIKNPFTNRPISVETFLKAFAEEIETGKFEVEIVIGSSLVQQAKKGNLGAIVWWDKTRGGRREADNIALSKIDPAGSTVDHNVIVHGGLPRGSTPANPGGDAQATLDAEASPNAIIPHQIIKP